MRRSTFLVVTLATCSFCALADPGHVRVTLQSQQEDKLSAFALHVSQVGESNVCLRLQVPDHKLYRQARLHLHVHPGQNQKVEVSIPVRVDRNEKDSGCEAQLVLPTDLARQAEFELLFLSPDPKMLLPPGSGIGYDIDLKTYLKEMK